MCGVARAAPRREASPLPRASDISGDGIFKVTYRIATVTLTAGVTLGDDIAATFGGQADGPQHSHPSDRQSLRPDPGGVLPRSKRPGRPWVCAGVFDPRQSLGWKQQGIGFVFEGTRSQIVAIRRWTEVDHSKRALRDMLYLTDHLWPAKK